MSTVITTHTGDNIEEPTPENIRETIQTLVNDVPDSTGGGEEPNIWLSYGIEVGEEWKEFTLGYYKRGLLMFTVYECEEDLDPSFEVQAVVDAQTAEKLWLLLGEGKTEEIMDYTWDKE